DSRHHHLSLHDALPILTQDLQRRNVDIAFETTVTAIEFDGTDSLTTIQNKHGETEQIKAKFVIDASGYGRVLPRLLQLDKPSKRSEEHTSELQSRENLV